MESVGVWVEMSFESADGGDGKAVAAAMVGMETGRGREARG